MMVMSSQRKARRETVPGERESLYACSGGVVMASERVLAGSSGPVVVRSGSGHNAISADSAVVSDGVGQIYHLGN